MKRMVTKRAFSIAVLAGLALTLTLALSACGGTQSGDPAAGVRPEDHGTQAREAARPDNDNDVTSIAIIPSAYGAPGVGVALVSDVRKAGGSDGAGDRATPPPLYTPPRATLVPYAVDQMNTNPENAG